MWHLHQQHYRYVPQHLFIAGTSNVMADDASRRWHRTDSQLVSHFNTLYPQKTSWTLQTRLPDAMHSAVIGSLFLPLSESTSLLVQCLARLDTVLQNHGVPI
jgi:hypothetical protein